MKRKNVFLMLLSLVFFIVGCGGNTGGGSSSAASSEATSEVADESTAEKEQITIGTLVSMEPMVTPLADQLNEEGYKTEVALYEANQMPAEALNNGDIDAVIANHNVWINTFNKENNGTLAMVEPYICYSPLGLYSAKYDSVDAVPDGATITIPGDAANISRSLYFLQDMGLITLAEKTDENEFYNKTHIKENPKNIKIMETEITALAATYADADAVINFPSQMKHADLDVKEPLAFDPQMMEYALGLIINSDQTSADDAWVQDAMAIFETEEYRNAFNEVFEGAYHTEW